ncbi:hypothetical protein ACLB2K_053345 [Fragaria x ananassa]
MNKSQQLLRHINTTVLNDGAFVLMGTNGCGQATFLHKLAVFSKPSSGLVLCDGQKFTVLDSASCQEAVMIHFSLSKPDGGNGDPVSTWRGDPVAPVGGNDSFVLPPTGGARCSQPWKAAFASLSFV